MGGLFQLINYGYGDVHLSAWRMHQPNTLQEYAFKALQEKNKTLIYNDYKYVFPDLVKKMDEKRISCHKSTLHHINLLKYGYIQLRRALSQRAKDNIALKIKENIKISEQESIKICIRVDKYIKLQNRKNKNVFYQQDDPLSLNDLFC